MEEALLSEWTGKVSKITEHKAIWTNLEQKLFWIQFWPGLLIILVHCGVHTKDEGDTKDEAEVFLVMLCTFGKSLSVVPGKKDFIWVGEAGLR